MFKLVNSKIVVFLVAFFLGVGISKVYTVFANNSTGQENIGQIRLKGAALTSPLLRCETPENNNEQHYQDLKNKLTVEISQDTKDNLVSDVSIYFREMQPGKWFAINDSEKYAPASLLKVPIMMAYFKQSESNHSLLVEQIKYDGSVSRDVPYFKPLSNLVKDQQYTVQELIEHMIKQSDNNATDLLLTHLPSMSDLDFVMKDIQLEGLNTKVADFMSVNSYADYFRTLFSASYMDENLSEKALNILTQTDFKDGINYGIPPQVLVAHKFGERTFTGSSGDQLHDCGIVYYPNRPYLICVMTKGKDFDKQASVIRAISAITYKTVDSWNK